MSAFGAPELAIAFDFRSRAEVLDFANELSGLPVVIKLGLGIVPQLNADDFKKLRDLEFKLFIDVKLHDIPSQVARAVETWANLGAKYLTVHCSGATQMMAAAQTAAAQHAVQLLGVTVLTSLTETHLGEIGWSRSRNEQVAHLASQGLASGLRGFVCPAHEVPAIKLLARNLGHREVRVCTPGLVISNEEKRFDQPDCVSVKDALQFGADLLVLGRSILGAPKPLEAVQNILAIMESAK